MIILAAGDTFATGAGEALGRIGGNVRVFNDVARHRNRETLCMHFDCSFLASKAAPANMRIDAASVTETGMHESQAGLKDSVDFLLLTHPNISTL